MTPELGSSFKDVRPSTSQGRNAGGEEPTPWFHGVRHLTIVSGSMPRGGLHSIVEEPRRTRIGRVLVRNDAKWPETTSSKVPA
jgi:hypothetical protein